MAGSEKVTENTGSFIACAALEFPAASKSIVAQSFLKLFVALKLEVAHHFIERFAFRSTGRFEPPSTFGATKTPKTLQFDPYQLPAHGCLCLCANEY
jgi:hypothetical protein